ncbi:hypothetical protein Cadr_000004398 [Camelus dromedarius]|uniref:Uncharacterized protein n=1 Tax=Camelus dromedarius TaxID=9838 RepID=A0A5N4ECF8_CAMDR|nr:hypothetical protein Cadr_000004398 [Camelus dromedarius]
MDNIRSDIRLMAFLGDLKSPAPAAASGRVFYALLVLLKSLTIFLCGQDPITMLLIHESSCSQAWVTHLEAFDNAHPVLAAILTSDLIPTPKRLLEQDTV